MTSESRCAGCCTLLGMDPGSLSLLGKDSADRATPQPRPFLFLMGHSVSTDTRLLGFPAQDEQEHCALLDDTSETGDAGCGVFVYKMIP